MVLGIGAALFILFMVIIGFLKIKLSIKLFLSIIVAVVIMFTIVVIGHSDWNREFLLKTKLNNLEEFSGLNHLSDPAAVQEIVDAEHPLKINILSSEKTPDYTYQNVVEINGKLYKVRTIAYTYPLPWAVYENWQLNQINFNK